MREPSQVRMFKDSLADPSPTPKVNGTPLLPCNELRGLFP